jgi:hypothetical protein
MDEIQKTAKVELEKLLNERYSLKSTIDLYEAKDLTQREREILQYGFEEGRKCELLVVLYDLFSGDKDGMKYVSDRVVQKIDELKVLIGDSEYSNLSEYLKGFRKEK